MVQEILGMTLNFQDMVNFKIVIVLNMEKSIYFDDLKLI